MINDKFDNFINKYKKLVLTYAKLVNDGKIKESKQVNDKSEKLIINFHSTLFSWEDKLIKDKNER